MAALTFTLIGVPFAALSSANGKYALGWQAAPIFSIHRWHVDGTDGSLVNHGGKIGYNILARVRYVSVTPYTAFDSDMATFQDPQPGGTIVGPGSKSFARCLLVPDGAKIARDSIAMGRGVAGQQFMDVTWAFISDGG